MNKKLIRLTESDIHRIVKESVKRIINERMADRNGQDYIEDESWPAGGGLDDRCSYNKECVEAFDMASIGKMEKYLQKQGFTKVSEDYDSEIWQKGNTRVYFDGNMHNSYGYMRTEYCGDNGQKKGMTAHVAPNGDGRVVNTELSRMMTNMLMPPKGYGIHK